MTIEFWISELNFSGGTSARLRKGAVVALVGPTNAGKTASLREIAAHLTSAGSADQARVVHGVQFEAHGEAADLEQWLEQHADRVIQTNPDYREYRRMGVTDSIESLKKSWAERDSGRLGSALSQFLAHYIGVDNRASIVAEAATPMAGFDTSPSTAVAHLFRDGALEEEFSKISTDVFGVPITLQRLGGYQLYLRVGVPDAPVPPLNRPTRAYADAEAALPLLFEQGHGMRSFLGLVMLLMTKTYPVYLIDEPEVFLHPPQRRELGRLISKLALNSDTQVILATHDTDLLLGLLDGPSATEVVRLTRDGGTNQVRQIEREVVKSLWDDPLLKHSRLFDGLFYQRIVVCESDADCQFYSAVLDHLVDSAMISRPDVLFVSAYGKDRVHVALAALRRAGVDVRAALDFDILRDEAPLARLVAAAGGSWDDIRPSWRTFASQIGSKRKEQDVAELRVQMEKFLPKSGDLDRETSKKLLKIFRYSDGWDEAKKTGLMAVPPADATRACKKVLTQLDALHIFVVPEGELESFVKDASGHGPAWLADVFKEDLHRTATEAQTFVRRLVG